jgi:pre-mRNA-splicing helicase BRR2
MRSWLTVNVIQQQFSSQPMEVLCGADDEVLTIVKNDKTKNPYNPISNQMFNQFVSMAAEAASS